MSKTRFTDVLASMLKAATDYPYDVYNDACP